MNGVQVLYEMNLRTRAFCAQFKDEVEKEVLGQLHDEIFARVARELDGRITPVSTVRDLDILFGKVSYEAAMDFGLY